MTKTDRLAALFPDAYAANDRESLLYKLLDSFGAELLLADDAIKRLLKSHWVNYAEGAALDALGAIYGVQRRQLRDQAQYEGDEAFRLRLKSTVRVYAGGGTRAAVLGAVRAALGLPYRLEELALPPEFAALRGEIEQLIRLVEFSPRADRLASSAVAEVGGASRIALEVDAATVQAARPRIEWRFTQGGGRRLRLQIGDQGWKADERLIIPPGSQLVLSSEESGLLSATLDGRAITAQFSSLSGGPPIMPAVPPGRSEWLFSAVSGLYDIGVFDQADSFDLPLFSVELIWISQEPLTFDVFVPYFLEQAVATLAQRRGYTGKLLVFSGLPPERIQEVIDQTRAAGVRGSVHFTLNFYDDHQMRDLLLIAGGHAARETHEQSDSLAVGSINQAAEIHDQEDRLVIGAVFDISPFDSSHGFM
jgi:hypothetical protein